MKRVLIAILFLISSFKAYCQHQFTLDMGHIATITFPDSAKLQPTKDAQLYAISVDGNVYMSETSVVNKGLGLFKKHFDDSLYAGVIEGSINTVKGKLLYKKNIEVQGVSGMEFLYTANIKGTDFNMYYRMFYLNNTLLIYACWLPAPLKDDDKNLKSFFNSFKFTISPDKILQGNASEWGYRTGHMFVLILIAGVVVLLGVGIIYIIKKIV